MKKKIDLKSKFFQTILLGLDVYDLNDEIIKLIKEYNIGGIVLYKKNYTSLDTMINFINKLKSINQNGIPLFIAIDQENGRVNRFPKDVERMYNALKIAEINDMKIADEINKITAYILKNTGVNMNFAPVLDIYRSDKNKVIGNRSYGAKENIVKYGFSFMKELQNNNIISVVKHFPGHGLTIKDSHFVLPKIKDVDVLEKEDIKVFYDAIKNGADSIMVGHLLLKGFGHIPASLNKSIISNYLLSKKFNGLLVTDDLRMNSLRFFNNLRKSVKKSIEAGNNVIMIKYKKGDIKLYKKLTKMVEKCEIDPECIDNSYKKIIKFKEKYNVNNELIQNKINLEKINKRIKIINEYIDNLSKIQ